MEGFWLVEVAERAVGRDAHRARRAERSVVNEDVPPTAPIVGIECARFRLESDEAAVAADSRSRALPIAFISGARDAHALGRPRARGLVRIRRAFCCHGERSSSPSTRTPRGGRRSSPTVSSFLDRLQLRSSISSPAPRKRLPPGVAPPVWSAPSALRWILANMPADGAASAVRICARSVS